MEQTVQYRDNQEVQAADLTNANQWISDSIDHIVRDAIEQDMAYSGFLVSKVAPTQVSIAPGRLYSSGAVYANTNPSVLDLYNVLPVTQKKQIAVVVWGTTIQQDIQPRDFIIDADTGQSQPQSVAMQSTRYCNVDIVPGVEGPSPAFPPIDATDLVVGYVLCDPTGVVSFQQVLANEIDSVEDLSQRMAAMEAFASLISGQVSTLTTALANLAAQLKNYVLLTDYQKLVTLVAQIWDYIHRPAAYIWYGTDNFLDYNFSNKGPFSAWTGNDPYGQPEGIFNAVCEEGLRFAGTLTSGSTTLQLANANDPTVVRTAEGFMLPTPSGSRCRMDCTLANLPWIEERALQYIYHTFTCRKLHPSRHRHRCGTPWEPSPPSQVWWYQAQLDPTTHILSFDNETWETTQWGDIAAHSTEDDPDWPQHQFSRLQYFWHDYVDLPYWSKVFDNHPQGAQHICQTFLNGQDGWLTSITLHLFKNLGEAMNIMISMCDDDGSPNENNVVGYAEVSGLVVAAGMALPVQVGDVETFVTNFGGPPLPSGNQTQQQRAAGIVPIAVVNRTPVFIFPCRIAIPPVFLQAGRRYGIHILTTADHSFCVTDQWDAFAVHQGTYWVSGSNGLYAWPSTTNPKSLRFQLHYATWGQWQGTSNPTGGAVRAAVQMQPLLQSGGMCGIDILADAIEPPATSLSYQVQVNNVWYPFDAEPNTPDFSSHPTQLPFQIVFNGTTDLMPGVSLTQSRILMECVRGNGMHHISQEIIIGSAEATIKVTVKLIVFNGSHHHCYCLLHYTTGTSPSFVQVQKTADIGPTDITNADGTVDRTWVFNTAGAIYNSVTDHGFYVEVDGINDGAIPGFIIAQEIRFVQSA